MNQLVPVNSNVEAYRASTDAAGLCKEIVIKTATKIQGRRYVTVEGWQAIAIAHGCAASADHVERVTDEGCEGFKATGVIRRMSDGAEIARAEGFLGDDETMWSKRPVYARRAMVQTRAISRACRSAFAHVVVMMDADLATTPELEMVDPETGEVLIQHTEKVPGITKIKERLRAFMAAGSAEGVTLDEFRKLKRQNKDDLKTIRDANHSWWTGDGEDFEGYEKWMARRQAELEQATESDGMVKALIESLNKCETKEQLTKWLAGNGDVVESLDGAESRTFQLAYDFRASLIDEMDKVNA